VKKTDAVKKAREYADAGCRSGKDRIDCNGCIDDLAKLIEEVHAAGKREGIEAAATEAEVVARMRTLAPSQLPQRIRDLLQTEARAETGKGKEP
jgi:hypothetical protein